jgi:formamidopyrimidine-DNA glycosylase
MEGARLAKVEVRDRRLRWPIARDFEKRLTGQTVEGLGRRAKYLLADLSSGEVLLMHLGMSGSFRVGADTKPGVYYHERGKSTAHDHVVFHMSNGATVTFNDPRRFSSTPSRCCAGSGRSRSATPSTRRCWRAPAPARRPR